MLRQFVNLMDEYLSNKPFKHRWWSRRWIVHMTIRPPLSKDYPLWKRNKDELRLLRLFDLSPEELHQQIERYWKKPRWRRWFASFGMSKKIDVWNYYQHCLTYQAVRPEKLEESLSLNMVTKNGLVNELSVFLHQFNTKFEKYLEKRCRKVKWIEKHFLKEIEVYKQQLKETFWKKMNKSLKYIKTDGQRLALKQQAELEYQQVEAFMLRYYHQWLNVFFSHKKLPNFDPELGIDVVREENGCNSERNLVLHNDPQTVSTSFQLSLPKEINHQYIIGSLYGAKKWLQAQIERLKPLLEDNSLQKVTELLQISLKEIAETTDLYLNFCETMLSDIQSKQKDYDYFLKYVDNLQRRLKPLLQGGILLFHPDHMMGLIRSKEMWEIVTRFSQVYLEQSRRYLDRFKNYHCRIEDFYQHSQQKFQKQQSHQDWSNLAQYILELGQSVKDLEQSFKELDKKLKEFETNRIQDKAETAIELEQCKAETNTKIKEVETEIYAYLKAKQEVKLNQNENLGNYQGATNSTERPSSR